MSLFGLMEQKLVVKTVLLTGMWLMKSRSQREFFSKKHQIIDINFSPMNGSARGSLMFQMNGKWTTKDLMLSQGFVCEKKTEDVCVFDMVPFKTYCFDFRLDARTDLHTWQGARDQCEVYGLTMMQIRNSEKDEFINTFLADTQLFTSEGDIKAIWLGAQGKKQDDKHLEIINDVS